jgi:hypothetical protein
MYAVKNRGIRKVYEKSMINYTKKQHYEKVYEKVYEKCTFTFLEKSSVRNSDEKQCANVYDAKLFIQS